MLTYRPSRKWVLYVCGVGIGFAVIGMVVSNMMGAPPLDWLSKDATSCRIRESIDGDWIEIGIADAAKVETLVMEPLRSAKLVEHPVPKYEVLGVLTVELADGSEKSVTLYGPFGYFSSGGVYYSTDFTELSSFISTWLKHFEGYF